MEKSFVFNSINGDRRYKAEDFREYFASFIGNGVFPNPSTNLQVIANNNRSVTIKPGKGWINGAIYVNTDDYIISISPADGVLNRIDRIVLRMDTAERKIKAMVKKGQFSSSPGAIPLQRDADAYEIALADIRINKGAISITQADIADIRQNKELCGIVHGTVDQVDVTTLFNQYATKLGLKEIEFEQEFKAWFETVKGQLSGDVAGNLANQIAENKEKIKNVETSLDDMGYYKKKSKNISNTNLNDLFISGNYIGQNLVNAPSNEYYRVEVFATDTGKEWCKQRVSKFYDEKETFERVFSNETKTWTPWFSLFQSVSSMKAKVASAVTDKGIPTDATATGDVMAQNIRNIKTGANVGDLIENVSITFPTDLDQSISGSVRILCKDNNVYFGGQKCDLNGNTIWDVGTNRRYEQCVAVDSNNNVYVQYEGNITKYNENGQSLWNISSRYGAIYVGDNDCLYNIEEKYIYKYNPDKTQIWSKSYSSNGSLNGEIIIYNKNTNRIYCSDTGKVMCYDTNGNNIWISRINYPVGIRFDSNNNIIVGSRVSQPSGLMRINKDTGEIIETIIQSAEIKDVDFDEKGNYYVSSNSMYIQKLAKNTLASVWINNNAPAGNMKYYRGKIYYSGSKIGIFKQRIEILEL